MNYLRFRKPGHAAIAAFQFLAATALAFAVCHPVSGDRILGRDLAAVDNRFSALPATAPFGYAPMPGAPRVFHPAEMQTIARTAGIQASDFTDVCFEIPVHIPVESELLTALRPSLPPDATIRLVDMDRAAIPVGRIEFPLAGLEPPAAGGDSAQLWRGFVQYTDTRRVAVWVRVAVSATYRTVIARKDLAPDTPIDASALLLETRTGTLKREASASKIEDVAGRVVTRPVRAGMEIPVSFIAEPPAVRRGDLVRVEVQSGHAVLRFDAIAETTARAGEITDFRNPVTGKTFRARAEAGSKAVVVVGNVAGKGPA
jgi:flagella basal body P-ring formation protein FlgA